MDTQAQHPVYSLLFTTNTGKRQDWPNNSHTLLRLYVRNRINMFQIARFPKSTLYTGLSYPNHFGLYTICVRGQQVFHKLIISLLFGRGNRYIASTIHISYRQN